MKYVRTKYDLDWFYQIQSHSIQVFLSMSDHCTLNSHDTDLKTEDTWRVAYPQSIFS